MVTLLFTNILIHIFHNTNLKKAIVCLFFMGCFVCGDECKLFGVVCTKGIVNVCLDCAQKENMPFVHKPTAAQLVESAKKPWAFDARKRFEHLKNPELAVQEGGLRKMVERNYGIISKKTESRTDLIDNFHWILVRMRRSKKLTQEQFAKEIEESVTAIKMAEQGIIPKSSNELVNKLERALGIRLWKEQPTERSFDKEKEKIKEKIFEEAEKGEVKFDPVVLKTLTISDLQEMKKKKEMEIFERKGVTSSPKWIGREEDLFINDGAGENEAEFMSKKERELSQKDIDDLIFGR